MTTNIEIKKEIKKNVPSYEADIAAKAFLTNGKISPRKIALMIDEIRNKTVEQAKKILKFSKKKAADMLVKVVDSAVANAVHNNHYSKDDAEKLIISAIWVGKGMMLKRTEPRARGSGNRILKRYSNVSLYLKERSLLTEDKKVRVRKIKKDEVEVKKTPVIKKIRTDKILKEITESKLGKVK